MNIIKLYQYQEGAFKKVLSALKTAARALVVMATGLGKTILSIAVVKEFITPKDKVIFLCHDNGILNKAFKDYRKYLGDTYTYAKFYGQDKDWEADQHHFVFATFQSVLAHLRDQKTKKKLFSPKHFTYMVVDESHHAQAETFAEVINYFKPKWKLGMTATPDREDLKNIRDLFGKEVVNIRLPEAIAKNWLTPIDYKVLSDGLDEEKIREICKEVLEDNVRLTEKQINEKIFIKVRTEEQCKIVRKYSKTQKAIVFCENIEHLHHVASILPSAVAIHSEQTARINDSNFELFEQGHVQHVIVVDKFNEGIDVPDTELLVFLRATNSERIFLQQLGRGLRPMPGKDKVTVLDFVANIDRIKQIAKLTEKIKEIAGIERRENGEQKLGVPLHVEGKGFKFDFSDQVVNLLSVFEKIKQDFYPTWQEASAVARSLEIKSVVEYTERYKVDISLPSAPHAYYLDFPGWEDFLETGFYRTWQEASRVAIELGIKSSTMYKKLYKKDSKLPSSPSCTYSNFPGYDVFLGGRKKELYLTWQQASKAAIKLRISDFSDYQKRHKEDPRLSSSPHNKYKDFPGYAVFLGFEDKSFYPTWQQASKAAKKIGIKTASEYRKYKYKEDEKLPSEPFNTYSDFPGWDTFLGKEKRDFFQTWQEASKIAIKFGIKNYAQYQKDYKKDTRLNCNPDRYYSNFPGWKKFLGKE